MKKAPGDSAPEAEIPKGIEMNKTIISIPFHGTSILALEEDGTQWVSPRHACDSIGIDWKNQHSKLNAKPWARVVLKTTRDAEAQP